MMRLFFTFLICSSTAVAGNETFQAALERLYPNCKLEKEILYLTKDQKKKIDKLAGVSSHSRLANRFKTCHGDYVYIDSHIVRTLNQTVVVEVSDNKVKSFNVSAFLEPKEYKAPIKWLAQIAKKALDEIVLFKKIDALSGATLTAKANVDAARRVLALDQVLRESKK